MLPNPDAPALATCDKNLATRVLAVAVYCKLKHLFFNETQSRIDIAMAFHCNASQLTKAVMGIDYKGGLHSYKSRKVTKRPSGTTDDHPGPSKIMASSTQTSKPKMVKPTGQYVQEDTLSSSSSSSSSSDSDLPPGLPS